MTSPTTDIGTGPEPGGGGAAWTSHTAFIDGPVHYVDFGGSGPTIVCVHGLGGSHQNWLAVGPRLAARHRVLALDLAGFGYTPPAGRASHVRAHRRLLDAFVREVVGEPVTLMGNSMGGLVSMLQADAEPTWVRNLVLINPALPVHSLRLDLEVLRDFTAFSVPGWGERVLRRRYTGMTPRQQVERTMELVTVDAARIDPEIMQAAESLARSRREYAWAAPAFLESARSMLRLLAHRSEHRERVLRIDAPALIIHGTHDRLVSVAAVEALAELRPDWQLNVLPDTGHVPQLEAPDTTTDIIFDWFDRVAGTAGGAATRSAGGH